MTITSTTIAGNLTRDPEIRYTRDGQATTSLSGVPEFVGIFKGPARHRPWSERFGRSKTPKSVGTRLVD